MTEYRGKGRATEQNYFNNSSEIRQSPGSSSRAIQDNWIDISEFFRNSGPTQMENRNSRDPQPDWNQKVNNYNSWNTTSPTNQSEEKSYTLQQSPQTLPFINLPGKPKLKVNVLNLVLSQISQLPYREVR